MSPPEETDATALRAKALLSRKRRKAASAERNSLFRPPPSSAGQSSMADSNPDDSALKDDDSMREEGEISDSDDVLVAPAKVRSPSRGPSLLHRISSVPPDPSDGLLSMSLPHQDSPRDTTPPPPPTSALSQDAVAANVPHKTYARPGLPMTLEEYETAKDIVLDLLGWGVPPEFLVDCGLSREILYYAFSDLRLRFPANLDWSTFDPTRMSPAHDGMQTSPKLYSNDGPSRSFDTSPRPSSSDTSRIPPTAQHPSVADEDYLHDIERKRRQELLARKAVQASLKTNVPPPNPKGPPPSSPQNYHRNPPLHTPLNEDVEMAPGPNVDDFLNSISPNDASVHNNYPDVEMRDASPSDHIQVSSEEMSHSETIRLPPRRSSRRPVAVDFVDAENQGLGNMSSSIPLRHRSSGNFANLAMRRCVIDLSDSEPEGDDSSPRNTSDDPARYSPIIAPSDSPTLPSGSPSVAANGKVTSLKQKEKDIEQLREMIAKREQELLKRASSLRSASTVIAEIKEEEDGDTAILSAQSADSAPPAQPAPDVSSSLPTQVPPHEESEVHQSSEEMTPIVADQPMAEASTCSPIAAEVVADDSAASSAQAHPPFRSNQHAHNAARVQDLRPNDNYVGYDSIFGSFPLLRSEFSLDAFRFPSSLFSMSSSPFPMQLELLRLCTLIKELDPLKYICQYEIPGGGVCRDSGCSDNHLYSRALSSNMNMADLTVEDLVSPSDDDTAQYLAQTLSASWPAERGITAAKIHELLARQEVQTQDDNQPRWHQYEQRVARVLTAIGQQMSE